jgi:diadenosine tetraphosphate (Ap4A) HIT family hydrolase
MAEKDCVFCNFDRSFILEESTHSFAAYFGCAIKKGHIVVALKEHVTSLPDLSQEQAGDLMQLASRVARKAAPLAGCEKFYLVSIADETPHYHVHLLPRMSGDAPIGPHVMGESGWRGEVGQAVDEAEIIEFIAAYGKM